MRIHALLMSAAAAVLLGAIVPASAAQAADVRFHADSGDSCRYGSTDGVLRWSTTTIVVGVHGTVTDRPTPTDPGLCRDDGYFTIATFVAYAGTIVVDRQARRVNNGVVPAEFTLGSNSSVARLDRVVIQVCRSPLNTVPPSYCGRAVEYPRPA